MNFSSNLRSLRISRHMSQKELAQLLTVTSSVISAYENDIRMPSYQILICICQIFDCTSDHLLGLNHNDTNERKLIDVTDLSDKQIQAIQLIIDTFHNI